MIEELSLKEIKRFFKVPFEIYKGDSLWVCPLWSDFKKILSFKNPFFKHSKIKLFIYKKNGKDVGRIAYIKDENFIKFQNLNFASFGFFESINDEEVSKELFRAVEEEGLKDGIEAIIGPLNPSTNEMCGTLIWGPPEPPFIMMPYNPPYYEDLIINSGYEKAKDLYAFISEITDISLPRLEKISNEVYKKYPVRVRKVNLKNFKEELENIRKIYNKAWEKNWGFVPLEDEEMDFLAHRLKPLCIPELLQIAFYNDEPAGFIMTLPDINEVLIHLKGKITPIGILKILYYSKKIKQLRLLTMGIVEEHRKIGIDACLYYESLKNGLKMKFKRAEFSWILEDNKITQKAVRLMGGRHYKTYRIYIKYLSAGVAQRQSS